MNQETEAIKQHIAETRESLSEKIDCLEQKVLKTVEGTTDIVANTAESVAEAVQDTVQKVSSAVDHAVERAKETFDLHRQADAHPWTMFGGSIAVGFIGGCILTPARTDFSDVHWERYQPPRPRGTPESQPFQAAQSTPPAPSISLFAPALRRLKDLAITAGSGFVTEMLMSAAPPTMHDEIKATLEEFASALRGHSDGERSASSTRPENEATDASDFREGRRANRMSSSRGDGGNGRH
jgi:ElaB/YqjD/DUF883 family membrane-anchored ribosome-binding protein